MENNKDLIIGCLAKNGGKNSDKLCVYLQNHRYSIAVDKMSENAANLALSRHCYSDPYVSGYVKTITPKTGNSFNVFVIDEIFPILTAFEIGEMDENFDVHYSQYDYKSEYKSNIVKSNIVKNDKSINILRFLEYQINGENFAETSQKLTNIELDKLNKFKDLFIQNNNIYQIDSHLIYKIEEEGFDLNINLVNKLDKFKSKFIPKDIQMKHHLRKMVKPKDAKFDGFFIILTFDTWPEILEIQPNFGNEFIIRVGKEQFFKEILGKNLSFTEIFLVETPKLYSEVSATLNEEILLEGYYNRIFKNYLVKFMEIQFEIENNSNFEFVISKMETEKFLDNLIQNMFYAKNGNFEAFDEYSENLLN